VVTLVARRLRHRTGRAAAIAPPGRAVPVAACRSHRARWSTRWLAGRKRFPASGAPTSAPPPRS